LRAEMGLPPLAKYLENFAFGEVVAEEIHCK
jgi:hypothetical protein